jgi:hypothetical protein
MPAQPLSSQHQQGRRAKWGCGGSFLLWLVSLAVIFWRGSGNAKTDEDWLAIAAMFLALIILPAVGVLFGVDLVNYLNWRKEKKGNLLWRLLLGLGYWLAGVVVLLCGLLGLGYL